MRTFFFFFRINWPASLPPEDHKKSIFSFFSGGSRLLQGNEVLPLKFGVEAVTSGLSRQAASITHGHLFSHLSFERGVINSVQGRGQGEQRLLRTRCHVSIRCHHRDATCPSSTEINVFLKWPGSAIKWLCTRKVMTSIAYL